ncbi:MAG: PQQ-dependent sugar dehydrogenase [Anaerolineae bacterium]
MMRYKFRLLAFIVLTIAACGPTQQQIDATATAEHIAFRNAIQYALRATAEAERSNAPRLIFPRSAISFPAPPIILRWEWVRELLANEVFDIKVGLVDDQRISIFQTQDTQFDLTRWLRYQVPGHYSWAVQVIALGNDGRMKEPVSPESDPSEFTIAIPVEAIPTAGGPPPKSSEDFDLTHWGSVPSDLFGFNNLSAISSDPNIGLYILTLEGDVFRLPFEKDSNGQRKAEAVYLDIRNELHLAEGIALHNGDIYITDAGRVNKLTDSDGDDQLDTRTVIAENFLPKDDHIIQRNSAIAFGVDGKLYVSVSATTDHDAPQSTYEATIIQMNADGSEQRVYASGLRDVSDIIFTPTGELFAVDDPPKQINTSLEYLPPGELNIIHEGNSYGFPSVFGNLFPTGITASEIGRQPVTTFPATNLIRGLAYSAETDLLHEGIYIALSGTIPTAYYSSTPTDRMVVWVTLTKNDDGNYSGQWKPVAIFGSAPFNGYDQPIDVAVGPDNALYIGLASGSIYRLTKAGKN